MTYSKSISLVFDTLISWQIALPCSFMPPTSYMKTQIPLTNKHPTFCKWIYKNPGSGTLHLCLEDTAPFFQLCLKCLHVYLKSLRLRNSRAFQSVSLYHLLVNINYDTYHCLRRCLLSIYEQGFIFTEAHGEVGTPSVCRPAAKLPLASPPTPASSATSAHSPAQLVLSLQGSGTQISISKACSPSKRSAHSNRFHQALKREEKRDIV